MNDPIVKRFTAKNGVEVTLYHGDCYKLLPIKADAVVTDPPYGIGFARQPTTGARKRGQRKENWDDKPASVANLIGASKLIAIWGGNYYPLPPSRGWLVWNKPGAPPSMADAELCWTNLDRNINAISWSIAATNPERVGHPTQKPVRVMSWTMDQVGVPQGATVLDPFMGSGTTGIACIRTGRNFIGIELDATHYKTACDRIEKELDGMLL